jgi:hypothetical protein
VERTLPAFAHQALENEVQGVGPGGRQPLSIDALHRVLRDTELRALPLFVMGASVIEVERAERAAAAGQASPEIAFLRGAGRLAERRYADAAPFFAEARGAAGARGTLAPYLWLYALASAGQRDAVEAAAVEVARGETSSPATLGFWGFLRRTYALDRPSVALR